MQVTQSFNDSSEGSTQSSIMNYDYFSIVVRGRREDMSSFWDEIQSLDSTMVCTGLGSKCGLNCLGRLENGFSASSSY